MMLNGLLARRTCIGLDIGAHTINAAQLLRKGSSRTLVACASFPRTTPGAPLDAAELRRAAAVLTRQGFTGSRVVVAVPQNHLKSGVLELPPRAPGIPMEQIARVEFARVQKCDIHGMELAFWDLPSPARAAKGTHLLAAGYSHADADPYLDIFESAGFSVAAVDTYASALARTSLPFLAQAKSIAVLDIGWTSATLVLSRHGVLIYERRLKEAALGKLHATIVASLRATDEVARHLLTDIGLTQDTARDAIARHLDLLVREVRKAVEYLQYQYPDTPVELLLTSGGGACIPGATDRLKSALDIEVRPAAPEQTVACASEVQNRLSPAITAALGLALFPVVNQ